MNTNKVWNDQVVPYARKLAVTQGWRFEAIGVDVDDFTQEVFFVYKRCLDKYGTVIENGKLSSRFKTSIIHMMDDLANKTTMERDIRDYNDLSDQAVSVPVDLFEEFDYIRDLVKQAPSDIKEALILLLKSPAEIFDIISGLPDKKKKLAEGYLTNNSSRGMASNRTLSLLLGYNRFRFDLLERTKKYIKGQLTDDDSCIIGLKAV